MCILLKPRSCIKILKTRETHDRELYMLITQLLYMYSTQTYYFANISDNISFLILEYVCKTTGGLVHMPKSINTKFHGSCFHSVKDRWDKSPKMQFFYQSGEINLSICNECTSKYSGVQVNMPTVFTRRFTTLAFKVEEVLVTVCSGYRHWEGQTRMDTGTDVMASFHL